MALSAKFGKYLKNFTMNWEANRFSFSEPFIAAKISLYSFSCYMKIIKILISILKEMVHRIHVLPD